jgi:hypothetical protein
MVSVGECPKCGSTDIYYNVQPLLAGGWIRVYLRGRATTGKLTFFACTQCYYIESFVSDETVQSIRQAPAWIAMNPRKSKRKNDE